MELKCGIGELKFTLEIKRAATGKTEIVELVGKIGEVITNQNKELNHDSDTQHSGA